MNTIAFLIPIYPPHFEYAKQLITTWKEHLLNNQSDLWLIFTNEEEKELFGDYKHSIVLDKDLRIFENKGIINIKKFYGLNILQHKYEYIIMLDAEAKFIKNVDLRKICENYFSKKILLGNKTLQTNQEFINKITNSCKKYFRTHPKASLLNTELYLWFNNPCIYKCSYIEEFFQTINYKENITQFSYFDFDYYIFMYYLILYKNFKIIDVHIKTHYAFCEKRTQNKIKNKKYKKYDIYMCAPQSLFLFDNPYLFLIFHLDRKKTPTTKKGKSISLRMRQLISIFIPNKQLRRKIRGDILLV